MKYLLFLFAMIVFVSMPDVTFADGFVPCGGAGEPKCEGCYFVGLIKNVMDWLIAILMVVFAVVVVVAGFGLVTSGGNPEAKTSAKSKLTNAIIGLIIVLAAWLMVDLMLRALLPGDQAELANNWGPWSEIKCTAPSSGPSASGPSASGPSSPVPSPSVPAPGDATDQSVPPADTGSSDG